MRVSIAVAGTTFVGTRDQVISALFQRAEQLENIARRMRQAAGKLIREQRKHERE